MEFGWCAEVIRTTVRIRPRKTAKTRTQEPVDSVVSPSFGVPLVSREMMLLLSAALCEVLPKRQVSLTTYHIAAAVKHKPRAQPVAQQVLRYRCLPSRDYLAARIDVDRDEGPRRRVELSYHLTTLPDVVRPCPTRYLFVAAILIVIAVLCRRCAIHTHQPVLAVIGV